DTASRQQSAVAPESTRKLIFLNWIRAPLPLAFVSVEAAAAVCYGRSDATIRGRLQRPDTGHYSSWPLLPAGIIWPPAQAPASGSVRMVLPPLFFEFGGICPRGRSRPAVDVHPPYGSCRHHFVFDRDYRPRRSIRLGIVLPGTPRCDSPKVPNGAGPRDYPGGGDIPGARVRLRSDNQGSADCSRYRRGSHRAGHAGSGRQRHRRGGIAGGKVLWPWRLASFG